ncbi:MAG: GNAT family N-acetyltransferase [Chlamydiales bacterium]|nr:GNAT family N-acetyltransferase [Chlamydiales bacterium]
MKIVKQLLTSDLKDLIYSGFKEYAIEEVGQDGVGDPVAFIALQNNECIGAVVIQPFWGALHIKYVWVTKSFRKQKIGTLLMQEACAYGINLGYPFAFIETMSFQALEFYQKLGFTLEFTRNGYVGDLAFHYLKKELFRQ